MDLEITENDKRKRHKKDENKTAKADQSIFSQPVWKKQRRYAVSPTGGCLQQYFPSCCAKNGSVGQ